MPMLIKDFLRFLRHVFDLLHFVRGVLLGQLLILILCSALLAIAEDAAFGETLYLSAITALTVGYGDVTPTTTVGRIVCVVIGLVGVVFVGLVVAVATRALDQGAEEKRRWQEAHSRE